MVHSLLIGSLQCLLLCDLSVGVLLCLLAVGFDSVCLGTCFGLWLGFQVLCCVSFSFSM